MHSQKRWSRNTVMDALETEWPIDILESIGDGVIVTDPDGQIRFFNAAAEPLTGWTAEEALDRKLDEVFVLINKPSGTPEQSPLQKALVEGHSVGLRNYTALISRDGQEKYISASSAPVRDGQGEVIGIVIVFRDINRLKLTGEQVIRERKNFVTIFEYAPIGMVILDPQRVIKQVNDTVLKIFGCEREAILNRRFGEGFGCASAVQNEQGCGFGSECITQCPFRQSIDQVLTTGVAIRGEEYRQTFRTGGQEQQLWLRISLMPMFVDDERNVVMVIDEITEQKEAELALKRIKVLSEQARDIMLTVDMEGRIIEANQAALRAYGYTEEELLRLNLVELRKSAQDELSFMQLKTADHSGVLFETLHYRKDGTAFPVEVSSHGADFGGRRVYLSIIRDTTERYQAQEALRESEKKFRELFNNANDAIFLFDLKGRLIEVNEEACRRYGYSREELLQIPVMNLLDAQSINPTAMVKEIIERETCSFELIMVTKDGHRVPVESSAHLFSLNGEQVTLAVVRDMTERKRAERELRNAKEAAEIANIAKSEFLANMSHEIRTPLNGIMGMTELTLMSELQPEQKENLTIARSCVQGLIRVINDILDFSKIEAGKLNIEFIPFQVRQVITIVTRAHDITAREKGVGLNCEIDPAVPDMMVGDPLRLQQVLNNLIGNAVKFTEAGLIEVRVRPVTSHQGESCLEFAVRDTGIGISPAEMKRLFKSFSQVDGTITRRYGGTGLGLVISKRLVEMMGGEIWVESTKGIGSTFYFMLSLENNPSELDTGPQPKRYGSVANGSYRILLVEDDLVNQMATLQMLQKAGHTVTVADNGEEALEALEQQNFDLVLMDIQTPKMDGLEATRRIRFREKKTSVHLPIIALTAHALRGDRERCIYAGMDGYVAKPFDQDQMFLEMERVLGMGNPDLDPLVQEAPAPETIVGEDFELDELIEELSKVEKAIIGNDMGKVERQAHQIKLRYGESTLSNLRKNLFKVEIAARKEDSKQVRENFVRLKAEFVEEFMVRRKSQ